MADGLLSQTSGAGDAMNLAKTGRTIPANVEEWLRGSQSSLEEHRWAIGKRDCGGGSHALPRSWSDGNSFPGEDECDSILTSMAV